MDDAAKLDTAKQYLRRKYANDLVGLKRLADTIACGAFKAVTITGQTFEGGSAYGTISFEKMAYLTAVEAVIAELDPVAAAAAAAPSRLSYANFGWNRFEA